MSLPACTLVSWQTIRRLSRDLARLIKDAGFHPDIVVAIGRGGYVPARVVCDFLHLDRLTGIKVEHYVATHKQTEVVVRYPLNTDVRGLDVLIVDDVNDSGDTLATVLRYLDGFAPRGVKTAVLHEKVVTRCPADFVARRIRKWRWIVYPWATIEDVTSFVRVLRPAPLSVEEARRRLLEEHGIRVPLQTVEDVLAFKPENKDKS